MTSHVSVFWVSTNCVRLSHSLHRPQTSLRGTSSCPAALSAASSWVWPHKAAHTPEPLLSVTSLRLCSSSSSTSRPHQRSSLALFPQQTQWGDCVEHESMICRNSVIPCVTALPGFKSDPFPDHSSPHWGCTPPKDAFVFCLIFFLMILWKLLPSQNGAVFASCCRCNVRLPKEK